MTACVRPPIVVYKTQSVTIDAASNDDAALIVVGTSKHTNSYIRNNNKAVDLDWQFFQYLRLVASMQGVSYKIERRVRRNSILQKFKRSAVEKRDPI